MMSDSNAGGLNLATLPEARAAGPRARNMRLLPLAFTTALAALSFLSPVRENAKTLAAFLGAAALLGAWNAVVVLTAGSRGLELRMTPKKQHYVQACAQAAVFLYWGWYWTPVYAFAPFIIAQLLFAYAFDMLLGWTRRGTYNLGFAPIPVIFSINLFLWFKPDWFFLQFAMIAAGLAAKETLRWNRDGRRAHLFNPSSFPLALFSLALLATGSSGITRGQDIAVTQFFPPHIYLILFLIGLPGQFFFGVTSMTMSAVVTTWLFSRLYFAATGIYFFYDSYIPIAVFLGMHLLFNDPSTSPRTGRGRILYGALYGLSTIALYEALGRFGMPTFYDKLLPVPLLNLSVKWLDRIGEWRVSAGSLPPRQRNLAWIAVWAVVFAILGTTQGLNDRHPGQFLPFWQHACQEDRPYACPYLADLQLNYCRLGSGWACNEAGLLDIALARSGEDLRRLNIADAAGPFGRGCELGFPAACHNAHTLANGGSLAMEPPNLNDYPIVLRGSKGEIRERAPSALYALACDEGWPDTCAYAAR